MFRIVPAVVFLLALVFTTAGVSQDKGKPKGKLPPGWSKLGLTPEQKAKAYAVHADYKQKIQALEEQLDALKTKEKTELAKILTEEQKEQLRKAVLGEDTKKKTDKEEPKKKSD